MITMWHDYLQSHPLQEVYYINSTIFPLELVAFLSYDFDSRELIKVPIGALEDLAFLYVGGTTIWFSSDYVFHIYDDSLSFHLNCI